MNIKRAKQEIKDTIEAYLLKDEYGEYVVPRIRQRPVLLLGAPGIGKTQIMEQIARECEVGLVAYTITHHTRQSAIGLPFISKKEFGGKEYQVTEYTMSEIVASVYREMEETGLQEGILFIDEINCVSETLAPAMLQFLQCKTFGSHEIPQGWVIVAAGNPPEYNKSVREFDVVTMDRVKKIEVEPDYAVWKEYARKERLHPAVISYLDTRTASFYKMETTVDGRKFATPRGWEDLSQTIQVYERLGKQVDREVTVQYIQHEKIAKDFANYLELYHKYQMDYEIEAILEGKFDDLLLKKTTHASFDERLSVVSLLLDRCRNRFSALYDREEQLRLLFRWLRQARERLQAVQTGEPAEDSGEKEQFTIHTEGEAHRENGNACGTLIIREIILEAEQEYEAKRKARLLDRRQDRNLREVLALLEECGKVLRGAASAEEAEATLKQWFEERQDALDTETDAAGEILEHVFDFMEEAFGAGQEMVIFITELNSDYYSVKFLQQYECERYYRYNKELLVEESSRAIEERIRRLTGR